MGIQKNAKLLIGLSLLALYIIWGSTYLAIKLALQGFPPFLMAALRFLFAGFALYLFLRVRGEPRPALRQWGASTLIGGLLLAGGNGGVVYAEQTVASGLAALVIATVPILTVLFARIWGHRPTRVEWVGLFTGFVGMVVLNVQGALSANVTGAVVLMLAAASWSFGSVWSSHLPLPRGMMSSAAQMLAGGALLLLIGLVSGEKISGMPAGLPLGALFYLIVFGSLIAFSAYLYVLDRVRPALATSYAYVNPVVAVLLGVSFAGESFTLYDGAALAVILVGVVLVSLEQARAKR